MYSSSISDLKVAKKINLMSKFIIKILIIILISALSCSIFAASHIIWNTVTPVETLPENSAVVPSMAIDSQGQLGIVYQSVRQPGNDIELKVGIPNSFNSAGESIIGGPAIDEGRIQGYKVAVTEWNFNGWWEEPNPPLDSFCARGLGAMGFLHAYMRAGDVVKIACQSMLVGKTWPLTGVRISETQAFDPFFLPAGQGVMLYSKYHGNKLLKKIGKNIPIKIDVSAFSGVSSNAVHRKLQSIIYNDYWWAGPGIGYFTETKFNFNGSKAEVVLPRRSVSVIQFNK